MQTSWNKCDIGIITYHASLKFWQAYNINDNQTKIFREDHLFLDISVQYLNTER